MASDDPPTPRPSQELRTSRAEAHEVADALRAAQRAASMPSSSMDMARASILGDYAAIADYYARRFRAWGEEPPDFDRQSRELHRWSMLKALIDDELGRRL